MPLKESIKGWHGSLPAQAPACWTFSLRVCSKVPSCAHIGPLGPAVALDGRPAGDCWRPPDWNSSSTKISSPVHAPPLKLHDSHFATCCPQTSNCTLQVSPYTCCWQARMISVRGSVASDTNGDGMHLCNTSAALAFCHVYLLTACSAQSPAQRCPCALGAPRLLPRPAPGAAAARGASWT